MENQENNEVSRPKREADFWNPNNRKYKTDIWKKLTCYTTVSVTNNIHMGEDLETPSCLICLQGPRHNLEQYYEISKFHKIGVKKQRKTDCKYCGVKLITARPAKNCFHCRKYYLKNADILYKHIFKEEKLVLIPEDK